MPELGIEFDRVYSIGDIPQHEGQREVLDLRE
jgi:hypothetical protein